MSECSPADNLMTLLDSEFFKALADPGRLGLLVSLARCNSTQCVSDIAACCPQSLSVVSRHLKQLKASGIISAERRGKAVYYQVETEQVTRYLRQLADTIDDCCPPGQFAEKTT